MEFRGMRSFFLDELGGGVVWSSCSSMRAGRGSLLIFPAFVRGVWRTCRSWRLGSGVLSTKGRGARIACGFIEDRS